MPRSQPLGATKQKADMNSFHLDKEVPFITDAAAPVAAAAAKILAQPESLALAYSRDTLARNSGVAPEGLTFEAIVGRSNLLPSWFLSVGEQRAKAICRVRLPLPNGERSGTGWLISSNILITNNHVLSTYEEAAAARCIFNYEEDAAGQILPSKAYQPNPSRLFITSPAIGGLDFTFVWLDDSPGDEFGFIPLNRKAVTIEVKEFANIIQHPNGEPKKIALQENEVSNQDLLVLHYLTDTMGGSSGGAVFNNQWTAIALHHAQKGGVNEGIKLSAIAAYLEQTSQDEGPDRAAALEVLSQFQGNDELMGFFGSLGRESYGDAYETVVNSYRGEANDIDIGFWNIEWFNKNFDRKVDAVARLILSMNLDIWAFEEVSPDATRGLVDYLRQKFNTEFQCAFSEPDAPNARQTTTVMWNPKTVERAPNIDWPNEIKTWFKVHSRDFNDLRLEAVEGKVFDRYPGLSYFRAKNRPQNVGPLDFFLVPLHLKAMGEGSKRRRMAAQILAAAVRKLTSGTNPAGTGGAGNWDKDWILGGDFNAELASEDFQALLQAEWKAISAEDEDGGAFTYVKSPKSLIDHIFLSPNLGRTYGADDYFIVAADRELPKYTKNLSDHRPVLVRLSANASRRAAGVRRPVEEFIEMPAELREQLATLRTADLSAPGCHFRTPSGRHETPGYIVNRSEPLYRHPAQGSSPSTRVTTGTRVSIISREGSYTKIRTDRGHIGYITSGSLAPEPAKPGL